LKCKKDSWLFAGNTLHARSSWILPTKCNSPTARENTFHSMKSILPGIWQSLVS
jgi:hypothetical protein